MDFSRDGAPPGVFPMRSPSRAVRLSSGTRYSASSDAARSFSERPPPPLPPPPAAWRASADGGATGRASAESLGAGIAASPLRAGPRAGPRLSSSSPAAPAGPPVDGGVGAPNTAGDQQGASDLAPMPDGAAAAAPPPAARKLPFGGLRTPDARPATLLAAAAAPSRAQQLAAYTDADDDADATGGDGQQRGALKAAKGWLQLAFILIYLAAALGLAAYQAYVDFGLIAGLGQLPLARGPAPGSGAGTASPAPEARVLWVLTLASLLASAAFGAAALLIAAVGQCVALRLRRPFRQRAVHLVIWAPALVVAVVDFLKLVVAQSVINKLRYQGAWYTFEAPPAQFGRPTADAAPCEAGGALAQSVRLALIAALCSVALNTLAPFAREPRGVLPKALAVAPAAVVTAVLWLKPTTAMMVWAFSQRWYTDRGDFGFSAEQIVSLLSLVFALGFSITFGGALADLRIVSRLVNRPLALCGAAAGPEYASEKQPSDEEAQSGAAAAAPPLAGKPQPPRRARARTLRGGIKALAASGAALGQLPAVFGMLAPTVLVASRGVWNFWVALDLIAGGAGLALLAGACAVMRCRGRGG
ncbi:hypothetical protein Rsub_07473 [Raphidocelis subcapitata]|uniref:Uncharacterized protein n=1 Tax=Raphidocelis subcapitata TaxID=307507 RepID=A0A2V0P7R9_9CHLO|nr:hypothetical protein Rsub_07473 [Raphidocelis subcapitata]|eukprot:GBF94972.1 hypothetical protein Rsub_07473 [Raphidocelis subcapitata]